MSILNPISPAVKQIIFSFINEALSKIIYHVVKVLLTLLLFIILRMLNIASFFYGKYVVRQMTFVQLELLQPCRGDSNLMTLYFFVGDFNISIQLFFFRSRRTIKENYRETEKAVLDSILGKGYDKRIRPSGQNITGEYKYIYSTLCR